MPLRHRSSRSLGTRSPLFRDTEPTPAEETAPQMQLNDTRESATHWRRPRAAAGSRTCLLQGQMQSQKEPRGLFGGPVFLASLFSLFPTSRYRRTIPLCTKAMLSRLPAMVARIAGPAMEIRTERQINNFLGPRFASNPSRHGTNLSSNDIYWIIHRCVTALVCDQSAFRGLSFHRS